ncbi:MAG: sulfotransferase [Thalassospira sp.]|uniref:tetratricopeptide repeat-containing sulfotransferase family protein n=1 Tax=Thalassospira sp. TaxID=1912094 RepID=UPI0032EF1440
MKKLQTEQQKDPKNPLSQAFRLFDTGNLAATENALRTIQKQFPITSGAKHLEAKILQAHGKLSEATQTYEAACNMEDATPPCFVDFADVMQRMGNKQQARNILNLGFRRFPQAPFMAAKLGLALFEEGHVAQSRKLMEYALKVDKNDIEILQAAGAFYRATGTPDVALRHFQCALDLAGKITGPRGREKREELSLLLAEAAKDNGDMKAAEKILRQLLRANPTNSRAWLILSDLVRFTPTSPEIQQLKRLLADRKGALSISNKIDLGFALGKAWIDAGDPKQAMEQLTTANRLRRGSLPYDGQSVRQRLKNYGKCFKSQIIRNDKPRLFDNIETEPNPLFIVGMPRSGTTLVEQVLASHRQVFGADELTTLPRLKNAIFGNDFPDAADSIERATSLEKLSLLAKSYLAESRQYIDPSPKGYRYLIDKMPGNFMFSGLIAMALPNAKIIHCRRNPIDTCLSCFSKYFVSGQRFSYDLTELGQYYRAYEELMTHWRQTLPPERFIEVGYENVVADIKAAAHRLTDFLGIDWDPALLTFHDNSRSVRTASANQVRQPIYRSSVERWRPYKKELTPLFEALDINPD